jgi:predicted nucleotidyltransferase
LGAQALHTYDPARRRERSRREKRRELDARLARAWAVAREAAQILRRQFRVERVVVFGSLVRPEQFTRWSDIDLAAYGLPPEQYYRAVGVVTGLSAEFKIDLVDPVACRPALRHRIEREGREAEGEAIPSADEGGLSGPTR